MRAIMTYSASVMDAKDLSDELHRDSIISIYDAFAFAFASRAFFNIAKRFAFSASRFCFLAMRASRAFSMFFYSIKGQ